MKCSICEREFPTEELKEADDFSPTGEHVYLLVCSGCESDFEEMDIVFNFKVDIESTDPFATFFEKAERSPVYIAELARLESGKGAEWSNYPKNSLDKAII